MGAPDTTWLLGHVVVGAADVHRLTRRTAAGTADMAHAWHMRLLGNLLWFLLAGLWLFVGYVGAGVVQCLTIIGIPFGIQSFKLALFALWPFGRVIVTLPGDGGGLSCLGNIVWLVFGGLWLALGHVVAGLLLCLTIVGIPFGVACMRMARLALAPFGKSVLTVEELVRLRQPYTLVVPALDRPRR